MMLLLRCGRYSKPLDRSTPISRSMWSSNRNCSSVAVLSKIRKLAVLIMLKLGVGSFSQQVLKIERRQRAGDVWLAVADRVAAVAAERQIEGVRDVVAVDVAVAVQAEIDDVHLMSLEHAGRVGAGQEAVVVEQETALVVVVEDAAL